MLHAICLTLNREDTTFASALRLGSQVWLLGPCSPTSQPIARGGESRNRGLASNPSCPKENNIFVLRNIHSSPHHSPILPESGFSGAAPFRDVIDHQSPLTLVGYDLGSSQHLTEEKEVEGTFQVGCLSARLPRHRQGGLITHVLLLQWNKGRNEICQQEEESKTCHCPMNVSFKETFENCFWLKVRARVQQTWDVRQ